MESFCILPHRSITGGAGYAFPVKDYELMDLSQLIAVLLDVALGALALRLAQANRRAIETVHVDVARIKQVINDKLGVKLD